MHIEQRHRSNGWKNTLANLLYDYRLCQASDPRDKVFALVGIAREQGEAAYTLDYSKNVLEVYRDLASHLIIHERNPNVLTICALPIVGASLHLPSWVPDWSRPLEINATPYTDHKRTEHQPEDHSVEN